ncbi:hypothetical protein OH77DRAFT_1593446 [Trametes cingulata]|nr:hypothetical protein OH77DRAFT_1593446 [Trametes cingulata]
MLFFPLPGTYAVVELDIENTLKPFDDPVAKAEAASLKTAKCLVFLCTVLQLPFPDNATFKYRAYLIGPRIRPEVPDLCVTSEMCMPIYPNTHYPFGDCEPLHTKPQFPFSNCYHWFGAYTQFELRILNDGRDYRAGPCTELPADQHCKMEWARERHTFTSMKIWEAKQSQAAEATAAARICEAEEAAEGPESEASSDMPSSDASPDASPTALPVEEADGDDARSSSSEASFAAAAAAAADDDDNDDDDNDNDDDDDDNDDDDDDDAPCPGCDECQSECSAGYESDEDSEYYEEGPRTSDGFVDDLHAMDIFGIIPNERDLLIPIVKIWLDIGAQFSEDDVPDPLEFVEERNKLIRIVEESMARTRARAKAESSTQSSTQVDESAAECEPAEADNPQAVVRDGSTAPPSEVNEELPRVGLPAKLKAAVGAFLGIR